MDAGGGTHGQVYLGNRFSDEITDVEHQQVAGPAGAVVGEGEQVSVATCAGVAGDETASPQVWPSGSRWVWAAGIVRTTGKLMDPRTRRHPLGACISPVAAAACR